MKDAQVEHAHEIETTIMTLLRCRDIVERSVDTARGKHMSAVVVEAIVFQFGGVYCVSATTRLIPVSVQPRLLSAEDEASIDAKRWRYTENCGKCLSANCCLRSPDHSDCLLRTHALTFAVRPMSGGLMFLALRQGSHALACARSLSGHIR